MSLTRILSSGLTANLTLGNVVISGTITDSTGAAYIAGAGGAGGATGPIGFTGSVGTGFTGSAGTDGATGFIGSAGTSGATGPVGFAGSVGSAGGVGFTGSQGNTGLGFAVAKSYATVAALTADTAPTGILAGQFAIIETGSVNDEDNSKLYLWSGTAYSYVTDLSGAAGITGPLGFTGSGGAGFTGSAGANGNNGLTGAQGPIGYTGSAGSGGGGGGGSIGYTGSASTAAIQEFVATEGQDTFTVSGGYNVDSVLVFVNGIQMNNNDYTAGDTISVILTDPRKAGDIVRVISSMVSPSININNIKSFSVAMSIAMGL